MRNELCLWCGQKVVLIKSVGGVAIAVQCPLCLDVAPYGKPCGKKKAAPEKVSKYIPASARRALAKQKAAKAARQTELFKK